MADKKSLFDEEFLKKLEYLYLVSKKVFSGKVQAQTRSKKIGWGMEFADHRDYNPGDDLRYLDWSLYGRMEQLVTKLFHEEENLNVYFLLDATRSMDYVFPTKFDYARKVVAALAYVALANLDTVDILPFGKDLAPTSLAGVRGKGNILKIFDFLQGIETVKATDMDATVRNFCARTKSKGLVVLISDFFDDKGYEKPLKTLHFAGHDISAICVHHFWEAFPKYRGNVQFTDAETGRNQIINISKGLLKQYEKEYNRYIEHLKSTSGGLHCTFVNTLTDTPFEELILSVFRQGRFVK